MVKVKHIDIFKNYSIPQFVNRMYNAWIQDIDNILEKQNAFFNRVIHDHFYGSIQSLLFWTKFDKILRDEQISLDDIDPQRVKFRFFKETRGKKRLELLNTDDYLKEFVLSKTNRNVRFTREDMIGAFQLYLLYNFQEIMPYKIRRKLEPISYYDQKALILSHKNQKERKDLLKKHILQNLSIKSTDLQRYAVLRNGYTFTKGIKNRNGIYKILLNFRLPKAFSVKLSNIDEYDSISGIYCFQTKHGYWRVGQSIDIFGRILQHKIDLKYKLLQRYNTERISSEIKSDKIRKLWIIECKDPNERNLFETGLQLLIDGELNYLSEPEGYLEGAFVKKYITKESSEGL